MRCYVALPIVLGVALFGCGGSDGNADQSLTGGEDAGDAGGHPTQLDASTGSPGSHGGGGGGVHGGRKDAGAATGDAGAASSSLSVQWAKACWEVQNGKRYQAIHFDLAAPAPVTLKSTLFFTTNCDPSKGTQSNDNVATIPSGSYAYWFTDHPDETSTSATWSILDQTTGCIDYQHAPDCH
jgi:hypothetical protein